jgi:hypothetical protein
MQLKDNGLRQKQKESKKKKEKRVIGRRGKA